MRIGILGGSFDPIHFGHLKLATSFKEKEHLDEIWLIPAKANPLKKQSPLASCEDRLEMARLAIRPFPNFRVLEEECQRKEPSYTIDTLRFLKDKWPEPEYFLLLGEDAWKDLPNWKEASKIQTYAKILVAPRDEISSTKIRLNAKKQLLLDSLVPKEVLDYIKTHHLYFE
jgi:nicotinate-nucleotide adenylyltransferase